MKNYFFILISFALIYPLPGFSQNYVSLKLGLNKASVSGDIVDENYSTKSGIVIGTSFENQLNNYSAFDFELLYSENGYTKKYSSNSSKTYSYDYYNFAFLFKLYFEKLFRFPLEKVSAFTFIGPNLAFLINAKSAYDGNDAVSLPQQEFYDVGIIAGGGIGYNFNSGRLYLETRYNLGFINIDINKDIKNQAWAFMCGYSLNLSSK